MKRCIFILLLGFCTSALGQDYDDAGVIFELIGEHAEMSEFFGSRAHSFRIEQFKSDQQADSLSLRGGCMFSFLENEVIQTCVYRKHPGTCQKGYWKWLESEEGDKFGSVEECTKKGVVKRPYPGFKTTEITKIETDSIVDEKSYLVSDKGDTSCHFNDRWIYRKDTLVEHWHDDFRGNCSWENSETFNITKYSYPARNTTIVETFSGTVKNKESRGKRKVSQSFNPMGKITSRITSWTDQSNTQRVIEDRYFYEDGKWKWTERLHDGRLTERIIMTTVNKT